MINLPVSMKILSLTLSYGFGLVVVLLLCSLVIPGFSIALRYLLSRFSWQLCRVLRLSRLLGRLCGLLSRVRGVGRPVILLVVLDLLLLVYVLLVRNLVM